MFDSNDCALQVKFGARVLQERQELFFALLTRLLLYRQVLFDRVHHVLDELEDLLLACFPGFALGAHCLGDCFGFLHDSFNEQSVLLLPLMRRGLIAVLKLREVCFKLIFKNTNAFTSFLSLLHDFVS